MLEIALSKEHNRWIQTICLCGRLWGATGQRHTCDCCVLLICAYLIPNPAPASIRPLRVQQFKFFGSSIWLTDKLWGAAVLSSNSHVRRLDRNTHKPTCMPGGLWKNTGQHLANQQLALPLTLPPNTKSNILPVQRASWLTLQHHGIWLFILLILYVYFYLWFFSPRFLSKH